MEYRVRKRNISEAASGVRAPDAVLSDAVLRRFHLRAGLTTASTRSLAHTRNFLSDFLEKLIDSVLVLIAHHNRRSIRLTDVVRACQHYGIRLYGYDDMCVIEGPWGIEEFHVTEMVEVNTTFSHTADAGEPDHEPAEYYKKTDFVQNQKAWDANEDEEEEDSDDSEWSWYSDSDADSDSEQEETEQDVSETTQFQGRAAHQSSRWHRGDTPREIFLKALSAAQGVVDDHLLSQEQEQHRMDDDAPLGQGYLSDCDSSREPTSHHAWKKHVEKEDTKWIRDGIITEYAEIETDDMSDENARNDSSFDDYEDMNDYVISRQEFMEAFYSILLNATHCSVPISTVALSALHNVSEQHLNMALTSGALRSKVVSVLMEEQLETSLNERVQFEEERQKVFDVEAAMTEMQASFLSREREMQRQIAELERRLRQQKGEPEDVEMRSTPSKSPGKRKASSKEGRSVTKEKPPTTTSIVGALRSRLHDFGRRKKARINPV